MKARERVGEIERRKLGKINSARWVMDRREEKI
jgi:hypothetical protein